MLKIIVKFKIQPHLPIQSLQQILTKTLNNISTSSNRKQTIIRLNCPTTIQKRFFHYCISCKPQQEKQFVYMPLLHITDNCVLFHHFYPQYILRFPLPPKTKLDKYHTSQKKNMFRNHVFLLNKPKLKLIQLGNG